MEGTNNPQDTSDHTKITQAEQIPECVDGKPTESGTQEVLPNSTDSNDPSPPLPVAIVKPTSTFLDNLITIDFQNTFTQPIPMELYPREVVYNYQDINHLSPSFPGHGVNLYQVIPDWETDVLGQAYRSPNYFSRPIEMEPDSQEILDFGPDTNNLPPTLPGRVGDNYSFELIPTESKTQEVLQNDTDSDPSSPILPVAIVKPSPTFQYNPRTFDVPNYFSGPIPMMSNAREVLGSDIGTNYSLPTFPGFVGTAELSSDRPNDYTTYAQTYGTYTRTAASTSYIQTTESTSTNRSNDYTLQYRTNIVPASYSLTTASSSTDSHDNIAQFNDTNVAAPTSYIMPTESSSTDSHSNGTLRDRTNAEVSIRFSLPTESSTTDRSNDCAQNYCINTAVSISYSLPTESLSTDGRSNHILRSLTNATIAVNFSLPTEPALTDRSNDDVQTYRTNATVSINYSRPTESLSTDGHDNIAQSNDTNAVAPTSPSLPEESPLTDASTANYDNIPQSNDTNAVASSCSCNDTNALTSSSMPEESPSTDSHDIITQFIDMIDAAFSRCSLSTESPSTDSHDNIAQSNDTNAAAFTSRSQPTKSRLDDSHDSVTQLIDKTDAVFARSRLSTESSLTESCDEITKYYDINAAASMDNDLLKNSSSSVEVSFDLQVYPCPRDESPNPRLCFSPFYDYPKLYVCPLKYCNQRYCYLPRWQHHMYNIHKIDPRRRDMVDDFRKMNHVREDGNDYCMGHLG